MELPLLTNNSSDSSMIKENNMTSNESLTKPVPRPFSIEALMSDCGPKKQNCNNNIPSWNLSPPQHYHLGRDTDSEGSLDMELAQDLSRRSHKDKHVSQNQDVSFGQGSNHISGSSNMQEADCDQLHQDASADKETEAISESSGSDTDVPMRSSSFDKEQSLIISESSQCQEQDYDKPSSSKHCTGYFEKSSLASTASIANIDSDDSAKDPNFSPSDTSSENESGIDDSAENDATVETVDNSGALVQAQEEENPAKQRKRVKRGEKTKLQERVEATLGGEQHTSKSGKKIKPKLLKPGCAPCKRNCTAKIGQEARVQIFQEYWSKVKNWDLKRQFVRSHVTTNPTARHRPTDNSRGNARKQSIGYNFDVKIGISTEKVEVCKVFFLNTLGISETVVRNALKKETTGGFVSQDMRGRHVPSNKLSEQVLDGIRAHINSFPCYESHYTRNKSSKKYLGPELNKERMYKLYLAKCEENKIPQQQVAKLWVYKKILSEFNLGFKSPSADTCDSCDKFVLQLKQASQEEEKAAIKKNYDQHLQNADVRYQQKRRDKEESKLSPEKTKVIMLDLQKCLPTPYLSNTQSFYFLKLWTLNLTIYDATMKKSYCMVWDESVAGRGGSEVASALLKWTESTIANSQIEKLVIWSDNCPGQNRNVMMLVNYLWLLRVCPNLKIIEHKFLLRGHTHMEADHVHGLIERTLKKQPTMKICTPWDWQNLIRLAGAEVIEMELLDFKKFEYLYSQPQSPFVSRKKNVDKEDFLISTVSHFQVRAEVPNTIFYKQSFDEADAFKALCVSRSTRTQVPLPDQLPTLRNTPKGVTKKKHEYLLKCLEWVPSNFHNFYRNMAVSNNNPIYSSGSDEDDN